MKDVAPPVFGKLIQFLHRLELANIYFSLSAPTLASGAVMVRIAVPGERWEVEFHEDGEIGVEVFVSRDGVESEDALEELFRCHAD